MLTQRPFTPSTLLVSIREGAGWSFRDSEAVSGDTPSPRLTGTDDSSKGTSLLEAYALEISLCAATRDARRMKRIYPRTLNLNAAVADPRIMGVIREEGGRMHMRDANFAEAYNEFYAGFRAYQEAGNSRAKDCLKYVVLANMLVRSRRPVV